MTEKQYPQLDVIAVGAHPDDVEIACGGTLARLAEQGFQVGIIDLTDGEPTPGSPDPETRLSEATEAAAKLGATVRITLDLPNRKLFDNYEARVKLATEFRKYRPRLVLGFGEKTPLASPDHWQAMQITDAAIFYSRLTKWDKEFAHHAPHTISAQLYFTLAFYSNNPLPGAGHLVVDISRTLATKMDAIQCYKTQFPPEKQHLFGRVEAMARQLGQTAGYAAGEMLVSPRNLGTKDLMKTLFG